MAEAVHAKQAAPQATAANPEAKTVKPKTKTVKAKDKPVKAKPAVKKAVEAPAKPKRKVVRRKRKVAAHKTVNYRKVAADLAKAGVPEAAIAVIVADLQKKSTLEAQAKKRTKLAAQLEKKRKRLAAQLAKVQKQIAGLDGKKAAPKKKATAKKKPATKKAAVKRAAKPGRKRRAVRGLAKPEAVLELLTKSSGKALLRAEVAAGLGVASPKVGRALAALMVDKKIQSKGQRRGTRYFV